MECAVLLRGHVTSHYRGGDDGLDVPSTVTPDVQTVREFDEKIVLAWRWHGLDEIGLGGNSHESASFSKENLQEL